MKKRTSSMSRRVVSLLMSLVLTLTLVTPAAFATEVVDGSSTTIVEGNTNPADPAPSEDAEGKDDESKNTEDSGDEQPTNPGDEDKNPGESEGDANKPAEDNKGEEKPDEDKKDEENKDEQSTEDENDGEDEIALLNDNGNDVWAGANAADGIDTSWYTDAEKDAGTADKPYEISTAAQLAGLAQLVNEGNNFSKKTIQLTKDIRLNEQDVPTGGHEWTPIGNNKKKFQGTFDGDGHTVEGLYINEKKTLRGLFGISAGTVKNLIVTGVIKNNIAQVGGVVGNNAKGYVINCGFYGQIEVSGSNRGGVVGAGTAANVKNCWFYKNGGAEDKVVGGTGAINCAAITGKNADLTTVNMDIEGDKGWMWTADKPYPVLGEPPKTITFKPIFPDYTGISIKVNGQDLDENGTYDVGADTDPVTISLTGSQDIFYYANSKDENAYSTGENGNLTPITGEYSGKLPITLFYGTADDFKTLAAWNTITGATITTAEQLRALARMVNSGKDSMAGKTITLGKNVDLKDVSWTPIGTPVRPFAGKFNGAGGSYSISGLNGDLFGVVKGTIESVNISGGTGRLVETLKSKGTVKNCMSTAAVTGGIGGLIGTAEDGTTVSSSYYYNTEHKGITVVGSGTASNCYYLAETSTFGAENDTGARTAEEFAAGRVT